MIFGIKKLECVGDWESIVSTKNWVRGYSAFELAHKWHLTSEFPAAVRAVLATTEQHSLAGLRPEYLMVEMPTLLDTAMAPSWTDIIVHARNQTDDCVILGVEGKAKESFAEPVSKWVRNGATPDAAPKASRLRRLAFLSQILTHNVPADSDLRYQLLHRTAATVLEGEKADTVANVVLVHSFDDTLPGNWNDFRAFLLYLGVKPQEKNRILGPVLLGADTKTPTFFAWVSDQRSRQ